MWARRRGVFWEWATDITIYLLELPAENVCWNCHIINRFGLSETTLLENLRSIVIVYDCRSRLALQLLGLLEHLFRGRWTYSSRLGLRHITSGVA